MFLWGVILLTFRQTELQVMVDYASRWTQIGIVLTSHFRRKFGLVMKFVGSLDM